MHVRIKYKSQILMTDVAKNSNFGETCGAMLTRRIRSMAMTTREYSITLSY